MSIINTFNTTPQRDGVPVISTINITNLINMLQSDNPDTYFDDFSEFYEVDMYFTHEEGRQKKKITHRVQGANIQGSVSWSTTARVGSWTVTQVRAIDFDGAKHTLNNRLIIGTDSDIILT